MSAESSRIKSRKLQALARALAREFHKTGHIEPQNFPELLTGEQGRRLLGMSKASWHRAIAASGFVKPVRVPGLGKR